MKICYVSNNLEIVEKKILRDLGEHDYDVHVVSTKKTAIKRDNRVDGIYYHEMYKDQKLYENRRHGLNPLWYRYALKFLNKVIKETKPDILHGGYASICGFICALTKFHPFLLMPWGSDVLVDSKKSIFKRFLVSYAVRNSDMITCDAQRVKNELVDRFRYDSEKIVVFPRGIDLDLFFPLTESKIRQELGWQREKIVVCTRQHEWVYGIEYLIESIPRIVQKVDDARFLFVGKGSLTDKYLKRVKQLRLEKFVKFVGFVPNQLLPAYLTSSDIYVSSSLSDGTSISLLEAMACGLPVVVSDVDAILEWIEDGYNGYVCPKKNSNALGEKITDLLENKRLREKMGKENLRIARKKADWKKNFNTLEEIYRKLLQDFS